MLKTFGYYQNDSRVQQIASAVPTSPEFASLMNAAVPPLLNRGDWKGTLQPIYVKVRNGQITWPRYVSAVRKLNICDREVRVSNIWHQFVDKNFYASYLGSTYGSIIRPLTPHEPIPQMNALGYYSTYNDVPSISYIQAYPVVSADIGKTVTIFGNDSLGNPLQTDNGNGTFSDGIIITLASPFGQSAVAVAPGPLRVIKDLTQGYVRLYAADVTTGLLVDLADYAPSETNPGYSRYRLQAHQDCNDKCKLFGVLALVKLEFIPVVASTDLVLIDNDQALIYAIQGIKYGEAGDAEKAEVFMTRAVHELNLELRNETPNSQISVAFNAFGSAHPRRHMIGRII